MGSKTAEGPFDLGRAFRKAANPELQPDAQWVAASPSWIFRFFKDKMTRIGINGFGRMGRLAFRAVWDCPDVSIVHVNEIKGGAATAAHLLEFDSVHGRWTRPTTVAADHFTVDGRKSRIYGCLEAE